MTRSKYLFIGVALILAACGQKETAKQKMTEDPIPSFDIIAYYSGSGSDITDYPIVKLDQIIFSFMHLKGNKLSIDNAEDSISLLQITSLKAKYPKLKVLVSLGGWGGCETCSPVFSTDENRKAFATSVVNILEQYNADGIDLDWEYPAIEGFPGHEYKPEDKQNFTSLVQALRTAMGEDYELSFAAGGFDKFLIESVEWDKVMPLFNRVNLMSYDLINGFSTETGHHTALFSNPLQEVSTDYAVQFLDSIGVPLNKIVIGAAFYARVWENVPADNNGLYQSGVFLKGVGYPEMDSTFSNEHGFQTYWDSVSMSPYAYSEKLGQFATYDNPQSVAAKVNYAKEKKLGGIMFWELRNDKKQNGLLDDIYQAAND